MGTSATARPTVESRLRAVEQGLSDVQAKIPDEQAVPVTGGTPAGAVNPVDAAAVASLGGRVDALELSVRTMQANAPDPNAAANREAQLTARLATVERILANVLTALGPVYDGEGADVAQIQPAQATAQATS